MSEIFRVNSPNEALELAQQFQRNKKYDLFRGQNENWPVISSMVRLSTAQAEINMGRINRLREFLLQYEHTQKYAENLDDILAIAQHYGIATDFIDFSSSPVIAMFFATHSKCKLIDKEGVVICLNSEDFKRIIAFCHTLFQSRGIVSPYIYETRIDNLWRLSAQKGYFLQSSILNLDELIYPFDKIVFPQEECSLSITEEDVYPQNKSDLEILLDNYFATEKIEDGTLRLLKLCSELGIKQTRIRKDFDHKYVKTVEWHSSWKNKNTDEWKYRVKEPISRKPNIEFNLNVKSTGCFRKDVLHIKKNLVLIFRKQNISRRNHISPYIFFTPKTRSKKTQSLINNTVRSIWDGMRTLPYSKPQIIHAIAKYLALELHNIVMKTKGETPYLDSILLEMSNHMGGFCRFHISEHLIEKSFRDDILDIQADCLPNSISTKFLLYVQQVQVIFDFNKLAKLFAFDIIPSMMLLSKTDDRPMLIFSPLYVNRIGYA